MRLHSLKVRAFGPFAGSEVVDFESLSADGLFLLNGPTGAGKSTILDAVCFALYGQVPGHRRESARLRSDHAEPGVAPLVELDFSAGLSRFRVGRSPKWDRPKKRGSGFTSQGAKVSLERWDAGEWVPVSTRADEVGHQLQQVLGLTLEQFTRVILLPQGQFAEFLHAKHDDRQALLERLFDTSDYAQVMVWLAEQRKRAEGAVAESEAARSLVVRRAAESFVRGRSALVDAGLVAEPVVATSEVTAAGGVGGDDAGDGANSAETKSSADDVRDADVDSGDGLGSQTGSSSSVGHAALVALSHDPALISRAETAATVKAWQELLTELCAASSAAADASDAAAVARHQAVVDHQRQITAWQEKVQVMTALVAHRGGHAAVAEADRELGLAREAQSCASQMTRFRSTARDLTAAQSAGEQAKAAAMSALNHPEVVAVCTPDSPDVPHGQDDVAASMVDSDVTAIVDTLATHLSELAAHQNLDQDVVDCQNHLNKTHKEQQTTKTQHNRLLESISQHEQSCKELELTIAELERSSVNKETLADKLAHTKQTLQLFTVLETHQKTTAAKQQLADQAQERADRAAHNLIRIRTERTNNMAFELAQNLTANSPCPVCGSTSHPHPTAPVGDKPPPTKTEEDHATATAEQTRGEYHETKSAFDQAAGQLAAAQQAVATFDQATLTSQHDDLTQQLADADAAEQQLNAARTKYASITEAKERSHHDATICAQHVAVLTERLATTQQTLSETTTRHNRWRQNYPSVAARLLDCQQQHQLLTTLAERVNHTHQTQTLFDAAQRETHSAIAAVGFTTVEEAEQAMRSPEHIHKLEQHIARHQQTKHHLTQELNRLKLTDTTTVAELSASLTAAEEQLPALAEQAAAASNVRDTHHTAMTMAKHSNREIADCQTELARRAATEDKTLDEAATLTNLAACVEGRGEDNTLKISLVTFVLAAQLEAVVSAATQRLQAMSGGRYSLKHTTTSFGNRKAGLGIEVEDGWTGRTRATGSLSGGESFMAALALALGLADIVLSDAGGTRLETLFVDEGFGSLDSDTLDEVLNCLDELRSGGRVIGLVSHVPELKERIQTQVTVTKTRAGSAISQTTGQ